MALTLAASLDERCSRYLFPPFRWSRDLGTATSVGEQRKFCSSYLSKRPLAITSFQKREVDGAGQRRHQNAHVRPRKSGGDLCPWRSRRR